MGAAGEPGSTCGGAVGAALRRPGRRRLSGRPAPSRRPRAPPGPSWRASGGRRGRPRQPRGPRARVPVPGGGGNRGRGAPCASPRLNFPRAAAHTRPGRGRQCVPPKVARPRARFPFKGRVRPACAGRGGGGGQGQVLTRARECPKARGRPSPASSGVGAELATSESSPNFWAPPSGPGFRRPEAPRWHTRAGSPAPGSGTRQTQGTGSRSAGPRG